MVNDDVLKSIIVKNYNDYKKTNLTVNNVAIVGVYMYECEINYKYNITTKNYTYIGSIPLDVYELELRKYKIRCLLKKK